MGLSALEHTLQHIDLKECSPKAQYGEICLRSAFQIIVSLAHHRTVGYEVLIRGQSQAGLYIPPSKLFSIAQTQKDMVFFDRLCRALHIKTFLCNADKQSWLFLNVYPEVMVHGKNYGRFFSELLAEAQIKPERVVIEILESPLLDEDRLANAVAFYRDLGCLVAIDDFGAGYSNFQRIWRLKPNIVKLDQSIIRQAVTDKVALRMLPSIVSTLHEAGSLVLMEGIETRQEALIALDANIDLVQGYYFSRPIFQLEPVDAVESLVSDLYQQYQRNASKCEIRSRYADHIQMMSHMLSELEITLEDLAELSSVQELLSLPWTDRCYILGADGRQLGPSCIVRLDLSSVHFKPMQNASQANWMRRPYWRDAVHNLNQIQMTRPYLSIATGQMCVTLSLAYRHHEAIRVFCLDLDYDSVF